jgi:hypothetical protein
VIYNCRDRRVSCLGELTFFCAAEALCDRARRQPCYHTATCSATLILQTSPATPCL